MTPTPAHIDRLIDLLVDAVVREIAEDSKTKTPATGRTVAGVRVESRGDGNDLEDRPMLPRG